MAFFADNLNRNLIFQSLNQVEVHLLIKGIVPSPSTVLPGMKLQRYPPSTLNRPKILFQDINIFFCNCLDVHLVFTHTTKGNFTGTSIIIQFINDTVFDRGLAIVTMFTSILQVNTWIVSRYRTDYQVGTNNRDVTAGKCQLRPLQWWAESAPFS